MYIHVAINFMCKFKVHQNGLSVDLYTIGKERVKFLYNIVYTCTALSYCDISLSKCVRKGF